MTQPYQTSRPGPARAASQTIALFMVLGIGGCAYISHPRAQLDFEGPEAIAPQRSLVLLPADLEQRRLVVRRHRENGHLIERIVLANDTATPGENSIEVETEWRGLGRATWFPGFFHNPFTTKAIEARIESDLARFSVPGEPVDRHNAAGPYRFVTTASDDLTCVYAWQIVDAETWLSGRVETFALDYRVCDDERSAEQLLGWFDQIDLRPYL